MAPLGQLSKRRHLQAKLEDLLNDEFGDDILPQLDGPSTTLEIEAEDPQPPLPNNNGESPRIPPNGVAHSFYDKWKLVLPCLVDALLAFVSNLTGRTTNNFSNDMYKAWVPEEKYSVCFRIVSKILVMVISSLTRVSCRLSEHRYCVTRRPPR